MDKTQSLCLFVATIIICLSYSLASDSYKKEPSGLDLFEQFKTTLSQKRMLPLKTYPVPFFLGVFNGQKFCLFNENYSKDNY